MHRSVAAVSVGVVGGEPMLDLCYVEDVAAEVDMNVVCTGAGDFVEVQGTAEGASFARDQLDALLDLAVAGCAELAEAQRKALAVMSDKVLLATLTARSWSSCSGSWTARSARTGSPCSGWMTSSSTRSCRRPA